MNYAKKPLLCTVAAAALFVAGCGKKAVAVYAPPPVPAPAAPETPAVRTPEPPATATARPPETVKAPAPPSYPDAATRARIDQLLAKIEDAYFDYDKFTLRPDAVKALQGDATELRDILKDYPNYKLTIEG